jgi:HlyD family secretion protein
MASGKCLFARHFLHPARTDTLTHMVTAVKSPLPRPGMDRTISTPWWRRAGGQQLLGAVAAVLLAVLAGAIVLGPAQRSVRLSARGLSIAPVERGMYHDVIPLTAMVVPHDTIYLDAIEGGRVERILAQAGDTVAAGQPLVELSNTQLELDVLDREGRLVQSITEAQAYQTQLEQNRVANEKALSQIDYDIIRLRRQLERREALMAQHLVSVEERDQIKDALDHALAQRPMQQESNVRQEALRVQQLPQLQAQIASMQQDLKATRSKLGELTVRAPVGGLLTTLDLTVGQSRNRGDRLAEITPLTGYKLSATLDEYYLARVHPGQAASVQFDERAWPLKVLRVYPQVKNGGFTVELEFAPAAPARLLRGQTLQGRLTLGEDVPGLVLSAGAFLERSGGEWAFVLDRDGRSARRRTVKIGRRNAAQVEVLSGLAAGERVITSDYDGLERVERIDLTR